MALHPRARSTKLIVTGSILVAPTVIAPGGAVTQSGPGMGPEWMREQPQRHHEREKGT